MNIELLLKYLPIGMAAIAIVGLLITIVGFRKENSKRKMEIKEISISLSKINMVNFGKIENVNIERYVIGRVQIQQIFKSSRKEEGNE